MLKVIFDCNSVSFSLFFADEMYLQQALADMLPGVEEANSISAELDKKKKFDVAVVTAEARGEIKGRTQVHI